MIKSAEKMISTDRLAHKFEKLWRGEHPRSFRAPGQVNLTGALIITTDSLLPMALNYQTTVAEVSGTRSSARWRARKIKTAKQTNMDINGQNNEI